MVNVFICDAIRTSIGRHAGALSAVRADEEAFTAQGLAVLRLLGVPDDDPPVNPIGGAIALGHPLGMSGARLVTTASYQLRRTGSRFAPGTMCIGVGQGIAIAIERV
jgi:acetyl-CoA acetyltransferase